MSYARTIAAARCHLIVGTAAVAFLAWPVAAGDEGPGVRVFASERTSLTKTVPPTKTRTAHVPSHTHTSRFASRVQFQMEAMSTFTKTAEPGRELHDNLMYDEFSQSVERDLMRTTRRALRDYLLEVTAVDRLIEELKSKGARSVGLKRLAGSSGIDRRRRIGFDFGVSHFLPEVGMSYEAGRNRFEFSADGGGRFGMRFRSPGLGGNQVSVGYNGGDVYYLNWSIGGLQP